MNVREFLTNYNHIGDEIKRLNSELNRLIECRDDIYNTLKAQVLDGMPKAQRQEGSDVVSNAIGVGDRYNRSIDNIVLRINFLLDQCDEFNRIWAKGFDLINVKERTIIELRYFQEKRWKEVAKAVFYCEDQCRRKADEAIQKLQDYADTISSQVAI